MNISEVDTLTINFWGSDYETSHPTRYIQTGAHGWYLFKGVITESPSLYTPQEISENIFYWMFR